ncbi:hypothetical protein BASA81_012367 [Batrachochytrium salamandrivorans]|nr:hypothetical protein BASA81_012367 [Batrachochytrium salamandrivorans]
MAEKEESPLEANNPVFAQEHSHQVEQQEEEKNPRNDVPAFRLGQFQQQSFAWRFYVQTKVLTLKNLRLSFRNLSTLVSQMWIGVIFLILLLIVGAAIEASTRNNTSFSNVKTHLDVYGPSTLLECVVGSGLDACYNFAYASSNPSTRDSAAIETLVDAMAIKLGISTARNVSGGIFAFASGSTSADVDQWILAHPNVTRSVLVFENSNQWTTQVNNPDASPFRFIYRSNTTKNCAYMGFIKCDDPYLQYHIPILGAVHAGFIASFGGNVDAHIDLSFTNIPHPELPNVFNSMEQFGATFIYIALTFNYIVLLTSVVSEKENHLVEAMRQMGLLNSAYWMSWILSATITNSIMVLLLVAFGNIFQFELFLKSDNQLILTILWLSAMSFTAFALFMSAFLQRAETARLLGIVIFIVTFIAAPLLVTAYFADPSSDYDAIRVGVSVIPFFSYFYAFGTVITKSSGSTMPGMTWMDRLENQLPASALNLQPTFWSVNSSILWLLASFFIFTLLAWYVEQIIPNEHGRSKYPWFFLQPSYWITFKSTKPTKNSSTRREPQFGNFVDEEVKREAFEVYEQQSSIGKFAVVMNGVIKEFGGSPWRRLPLVGSWFQQPFVAVNNVYYGMNYGELTAILGHNGSGKSTTFNMLTGSSSMSYGDATIFGVSVSGDMSEVRARMGVCPQHDVLWDQLTAKEHLELFSLIKGIARKDIPAETRKRLEQVKLLSASNSYSGGYSGGMKRRLSIAIAMLGDPALVYLDEPTTGMDPVTRRDVLSMISDSKNPNRVIILTSHAMEEVEMLADKIVVMSHGNIQAIGTVLKLKKKFGLGYKMTMFGSTIPKLTEYFNAQQVEFKVESDGSDAIFVSLPKATAAQLIPLFAQFEQDKVHLGVEDYSLSLSTLEEVFLNLSQSEEDREREKLESTNPNWKARLMECEAYQPTFNPEKRVSLFDQCNALFWKTWTFQMRNMSSLCCTIMYPIVIMILLVVLDIAVFEPLKVTAVCGKNVTANDCLTAGPDLTCVGTLYQFRPTTMVDTAVIGRITAGSAAGSGANPNCNTDICFTDLEKMDSANFPLSYDNTASVSPTWLGESELGNTTAQRELFEWHSNLLFLLDLSSTSCDADYDDAFTCNSTLKGQQRTDCLDDRRSLTEAQEYAKSLEDQTSATPGLGSCLRTAGGQLKVPNQYYLDRITALDQAKAACVAAFQLDKLIPHFQGTNLTLLLEQTVHQSSGYLESFGLEAILNDQLKDLNTDLWKICIGLGPTAYGPTFLLDVQIWAISMGIDPTDYQYIPTMKQICQAENGLGNALFKPQLTVFFSGNPAYVESLCDGFSNLDLVRGFSVKQYASRTDMDTSIYSQWYGRKIQTALMDSTTFSVPEESYRRRQYLARVTALHLHELSNSSLRAVVYFNKTADGNNDNANWIVASSLVMNAYVKQQLNGRSVQFRLQAMAKRFECNRDEWLMDRKIKLKCDILPGALKVSIIDFVAMLLFPFLFFTFAFLVVNQIVYEKEQRLRVIMRMNGGLKNTAYWGVAFLFFLTQFILMGLAIYVLGVIAKLQFVALHGAGVYWAFILSWGPLLIVFSFFMSLWFATSQSSTAGVFLFVLIVNLVGIQIISNLAQDPLSTEASYASLMWLPPFVMIRYIVWVALAGALGDQITNQEIATFADGGLSNALGIMWGEFFALVLLVWYLDHVYVAGFGTRKTPLFFLDRKFWSGEKQGNSMKLSEYPIHDSVKDKLHTINNPDVLAEYQRVVDETSPNITVRICRLHKEFNNGFLAVRSLTLGINENECFGLLGHNGAGKTTAISMLVGLYEPTSGTALVDGLSINTDMDLVQSRMGVTPQHDVCWGPLSVRDHLLFYARLKGVPRRELSLAVDKALYDVNLKQFEHRPSAKLSGGMRRRLSTAMSLIGAPRVVYLDEPSTGLDPASKRALWKVIAKAKGNKSLVLTTHSLEEAEALCDRIGIMALGEMQCLGTAPQLKQRYGAGYTFFIATKPEANAPAVAFAERFFGKNNCKLLGRPIGGTFKFEVQRSAVVLSRVFATMESDETRSELSLLDWSLTETTLEEVFLKLADIAHVDEVLSAPLELNKRRGYFSCCRAKSAPTATKDEDPALQVDDDKA